jgi:hypothetical protein
MDRTRRLFWPLRRRHGAGFIFGSIFCSIFCSITGSISSDTEQALYRLVLVQAKLTLGNYCWVADSFAAKVLY